MAKKNKKHKVIYCKRLNYFQLITSDKYESGRIMEESIRKGDVLEVTAQDLQQLMEQGRQKYALYKRVIRSSMNVTRAVFIKDLRQNQHYSWRMIAARCWTEWKGMWQPPTNQLAGKAICEIASEILDEVID